MLICICCVIFISRLRVSFCIKFKKKKKTVAKNDCLLLVIWGLQWLDTNGNSMLNWFLHTEWHFINTTNYYIQTLRTKAFGLKQGKRLFNKQDKILIC